jgi:hypothetical protein
VGNKLKKVTKSKAGKIKPVDELEISHWLFMNKTCVWVYRMVYIVLIGVVNQLIVNNFG